MEWITIPGATFQQGLEEAQADHLQKLHGPTPFPFHREMPVQTVTVSAFRITKTPVTHGDYREFVERGGYDRDEYWVDLAEEKELLEEDVRRSFCDQEGWPGPLTWSAGKPPEGQDDHPVHGVSWFEAAAFCRFQGWRLPRESEWELAARGTSGQMYPWGDDFRPENCACLESGQKGTVPVDHLPAGASPYGLLHMAGNVAEWCQELYLPYGGQASPENLGSLDRVLRGDFYLGLPESLRVTVRTPRNPLDRFRGLGFRCVQGVDP